MKQFFLIVFGGLALIGGAIGISYGGAKAWFGIKSYSAKHGSVISQVAAAISSQPADGTTISGIKRTIAYTADEEEDLINAATLSLPRAADAHISALAYVVRNIKRMNATTEYNADTIMPIASLSKLVTAIMARKLIAPDEHITITRDIMATYGNTAQFRTEEKFRAEDLYYPLLMVSSNDAAEAFAQDYGRKNFIQAMNDFVQSIGAYHTYFADPSGLSASNVSTANDLATILGWIRANDPDIIAITDLKSKTVRSHTWVNPTHFLNWSNYIGGKNGYTPEANRTGAALFSLGSKKEAYAIVILGSSARDSDMVTLLGKVRD